MIKESFSEEFLSGRVNHAIERTLIMDKDYQKIIKEYELFDNLERIELSNEQKLKVDRVISAHNACGAAYGNATYKQGFQDADKRTELI